MADTSLSPDQRLTPLRDAVAAWQAAIRATCVTAVLSASLNE
jgi:hypothetical protein